MPRTSASPARMPAGCAALVRVEQIHTFLRAVPSTPTGKGRVTSGMLAKELGVSRNTIKSDLALLEGFNAPIAYDAVRRTLYYRGPFELRPSLSLAPHEMIALFVAARLASHSRVLPVGRTLVRALKRLAPLVQGSASFAPDFLDPVFSTPESPITEAEARNFTLLCEAIAARLEVRVVYQKARDAASPQARVIHPLHWYIRPDACLLVHHEPALHARRNFELARIREVELTGAKFDWPKDFDLRKHMAGSFGRFIGEPVHAVRVVFDRELVPFVREQPWQSNQKLIERPDGSAEATYQVCHTADLEQCILRAGGQAEVISPPDVRARIAAAAARIIERHTVKPA
jgi:predicted DNA-binding transcriptional regulator YafY